MLQVQIGKGLALDVDVSKLNSDVTEHVMRIGLRNILMDSHAGATAKSDPEEYLKKSRELAEKKLASMYAGIVRAQVAGGPKQPTDPVSQDSAARAQGGPKDRGQGHCGCAQGPAACGVE